MKKKKSLKQKGFKVIEPFHRKFLGGKNFTNYKKTRLESDSSVKQRVLAEQERDLAHVLEQSENASLKLRIEQLKSRMRNSTEVDKQWGGSHPPIFNYFEGSNMTTFMSNNFTGMSLVESKWINEVCEE